MKFNQVVEILINKVKFTNEDFFFEFDIEYDKMPDLDHADVIMYNLSDAQINKLKNNSQVVINAGYKGDVGTVYIGRIYRVQTEKDGVNKITEIWCTDGKRLKDAKKISKSFKEGIRASTILNNLANTAKLSVGALDLNADLQYRNGKNLNGRPIDLIKEIAEDCATDFYINKGIAFLDKGRNENKKAVIKPLYKSKTVTEKYKKTTTKPFKVGMVVKLKKSAKRYATGELIPAWVKQRNHTIMQLRTRKRKEILFREIYSWVYQSDVIVQKTTVTGTRKKTIKVAQKIQQGITKKNKSKITIPVNKNTGLIGTPKRFDKEIEMSITEQNKRKKGFIVRTLLDHRVKPNDILRIKSDTANGDFEVISGVHTYNGTNLFTESEVIAK